MTIYVEGEKFPPGPGPWSYSIRAILPVPTDDIDTADEFWTLAREMAHEAGFVGDRLMAVGINNDRNEFGRLFIKVPEHWAGWSALMHNAPLCY